MITKNDCLLLLTDLTTDDEVSKEELQKMINLTVTSNSINVDVLKFINNKRQLDLCNFYEQLRHNYNNKKSKLYKNIVKEIDEPQEVLTTLSALVTQILLFSKKCDNKELFLKHSRISEITKVITNYCETYDITLCIKLLRIIKTDIKCLESIKN